MEGQHVCSLLHPKRSAVAISYTTPPTFSAGATLAAADVNILGDDIVYLKGIADGVTASGVQVYRSSSASISNNTATAITWQVEAFDLGNYWTSGTNIVVPSGAIPATFTTVLYQCVTRIQFASNSTGIRRVAMLLNGSEFARQTVTAINGDTTDIVCVDFVTAAAADVFTVQVTQTSGGSLNLTAAIVSVIRHAPAS